MSQLRLCCLAVNSNEYYVVNQLELGLEQSN